MIVFVQSGIHRRTHCMSLISIELLKLNSCNDVNVSKLSLEYFETFSTSVRSRQDNLKNCYKLRNKWKHSNHSRNTTD